MIGDQRIIKTRLAGESPALVTLYVGNERPKPDWVPRNPTRDELIELELDKRKHPDVYTAGTAPPDADLRFLYRLPVQVVAQRDCEPTYFARWIEAIYAAAPSFMVALNPDETLSTWSSLS